MAIISPTADAGHTPSHNIAFIHPLRLGTISSRVGWKEGRGRGKGKGERGKGKGERGKGASISSAPLFIPAVAPKINKSSPVSWNFLPT